MIISRHHVSKFDLYFAKTLFVSSSLFTFLLDIRIASNQCIASRKGHGLKYQVHENQVHRSGTTVSDIASAIETNSKFGLRVQLMGKTEMKMALRLRSEIS